MFTGLIDSVGTIDRIGNTPAGLELMVGCDYVDLVAGESVAVNGACLTVRECSPRAFTVAAVATTLERTAIGHWSVGKRVNLERAMRSGDRMGGHMVLGHVDCVGRVIRVWREGDALLADIRLPGEVWELMVPQGSLAVDGVSLTVNALPSRESAQVSVVEYTLSHTALAKLAAGDEVHVEADVIGKHVRHLLAPWFVALGTLTQSE